ncbi:MAG: Gfo/Idh/MocA family oxidoreductase [Leptolyngbyaceae cyanobacterium RM1_1_2]|nr:Gfo/Idh/MocA family oxidoreductase [Leptolyngbyaceae cyanobacterium RM1_1_2]
MSTETPSSQSELGVAVVGTGFGQKIHIPGLQAHHRTRLVAVYHRNLDKAEAIAAAHNIPHACSTLEAVLALPEVSAVTVSTPPFLHYAMAKQVLEADKHLLLEKPTALSVAEARELDRLAQVRSRVAVVDFEFRFVPAWQRLAELLADGYVGNKRLVKVDWLAGSRANPDRNWNWYALKDKGGGALGSIGSHVFDYIAWLFGPVQQLCGRLHTSITERPDPASGELKQVDADDTCTLMLDLQDGTPCQITLSAVAYAGRGHWVEVYGDRATLVLGSSNSKDYVHGFKLYGAPAGESLAELEVPARLEFPQTYEDGRLAPFVRVVNHWVECIDQGYATAPSLIEGCYAQLLMDLTHQSHQQGGWVRVPPLL